MTASKTISETMTEKWKDPEYRAKMKVSCDRAWSRKMKSRLAEMSKNSKEES